MKNKYRANCSEKIKRIIHIIEILYAAKPINTLEIAKKFGVSKRTIERDIQIIKKNMVNYDKIKSASYDVKSGNAMIKNTLLNFAKALGKDFYKKALELFSNLKKVKTLEIIPLKPKLREERGLYSDMIEKIREAVERAAKINLEYSKSDGIIEKKSVTPCAVLYYDNYLYLYGFIEGDQNKKRTFRFDRIKKVEITEETSIFTYNINELSEISNIWALSENEKVIKVELKAWGWAYDFFKNFNVLKNQTIKEDNSKYLVLEGEVSNIHEVLPYVMRFAPYLEVIKGKEILAEAKKRMKEFLNKHKTK
ncbi:MAG: helix-turn-helix transcriptional regulator [Elusimicrobiales bacterium]|nr:WYL domain-containing transcriptional regulator [Elusimicrobiales bacterium]HOL61881.1 WYL domain-containing transcriptional regulator [Elusimicrobiales bacterium]HPO95099.1 WYL domain-containing transcriptional regulator [Elusimicrobiales bacterium]